ncbi:MAG: DUF2249 domain-containing protein [Pseudomonadota bacterium]
MKPDIEVDARWLDPPEPMEKVLDAIGRLESGQRIRFLIHREPLPLYNLLKQMGLAHRTRPIEDHCYEVTIFEPGSES